MKKTINMKLLFITGCYPSECYKEIQTASRVPLQNASNTFQWAVIDGLLENDVDFTIACSPFIPTFPINYKRLFTPYGIMRYNGRDIGHYLKRCTLIGIKKKSLEHSIFNYANEWCKRNSNEDKLGILIYTPFSGFLNPIIKLKKKYPQIIITSIVTDLIEDVLFFSSNRNLIKRFLNSIEATYEKNNFQKIDKYVLLTKAMEERIPESKGRNIVVEGIYSPCGSLSSAVKKNSECRTILYTGSLQEFAGVVDLVNAFKLINNKDCRLIICGSGECSSYIEESSRKDNRIIFKGVLSREEILALQQSSTLLVNPRRPDNLITKYSFPSKTMEYLASGTPMLGYMLPGIPEEYYDYFLCIDDLSKNGLLNALNMCLEMPEEVLCSIGKKAKEFILNNKNSCKQVSRIMRFIEE